MSVWKSTAKLTPAVDNRLKTLEETIHEYEIYHLITEGTTGSVEKPTHGDIIMDQYPAGGDCIIVKTDSTTQKPIEALVYDASGVLVEGTLDINGNYILSGVPATYPVAIVFQVSLAEMYKTLELSNDKILNEMQIPNVTSHEDLSNISQAGTGVLDGHISDQAQTIAGDKTYSGTAVFNEAVTFKGDIIQQGTGKITYTEDVRTKNDLITLRDGAITGLDIGEYTGLKAKLYDGVNDGLFVIDRDGYFKVGDEGNLVTLTGREDSPIDQAFGYWDDTTKIFKTKTISSSDLTDNSSIVKTSGIQTIEGVKTFSSSPIVPAGDATGEAVNYDQLTLVDQKHSVVDCSSRVAEYTGDGIPVIPDNVAGRTYFQDAWATTDGWANDGGQTVSVESNSLKVVSTLATACYVFKGSATYQNKFVVAKIRASLPILSISYKINATDYIEARIRQTGANECYAYFYFSRSDNDNLLIALNRTDGVNNKTMWIESLYVGTGAYDTPALDRAGNGNNLTLKAVTPVNGKYGKEMSFNGSTSFAQASSPVIGTTGTIAVRFKRNVAGVSQRLFNNNSDGAKDGCSLIMMNTNNIMLYTLNDSGETPYTLKTGFTDVSNYHTGVLRITGSQIIFMFDGVDYTFTQTADMVSGLANLTLGRRAITSAGYDYFLNGIISHFRYDSRIWTAEEARAWSLNPISIDSRV